MIIFFSIFLNGFLWTFYFEPNFYAFTKNLWILKFWNFESWPNMKPKSKPHSHIFYSLYDIFSYLNLRIKSEDVFLHIPIAPLPLNISRTLTIIGKWGITPLFSICAKTQLIHNSRNPLQLEKYLTIIIRCMLAKPCGPVLQVELNNYTKTMWWACFGNTRQYLWHYVGSMCTIWACFGKF